MVSDDLGVSDEVAMAMFCPRSVFLAKQMLAMDSESWKRSSLTPRILLKAASFFAVFLPVSSSQWDTNFHIKALITAFSS